MEAYALILLSVDYVEIINTFPTFQACMDAASEIKGACVTVATLGRFN